MQKIDRQTLYKAEEQFLIHTRAAQGAEKLAGSSAELVEQLFAWKQAIREWAVSSDILGTLVGWPDTTRPDDPEAQQAWDKASAARTYSDNASERWDATYNRIRQAIEVPLETLNRAQTEERIALIEAMIQYEIAGYQTSTSDVWRTAQADSRDIWTEEAGEAHAHLEALAIEERLASESPGSVDEMIAAIDEARLAKRFDDIVPLAETLADQLRTSGNSNAADKFAKMAKVARAEASKRNGFVGREHQRSQGGAERAGQTWGDRTRTDQGSAGGTPGGNRW